MDKMMFKETKKQYISCFDKEVAVLDKLNAYFRKYPDKNTAFIDECHKHMGRWGRIRRAQYDTLRSIWNNLDWDNVDEKLRKLLSVDESCGKM